MLQEVAVLASYPSSRTRILWLTIQHGWERAIPGFVESKPCDPVTVAKRQIPKHETEFCNEDSKMESNRATSYHTHPGRRHWPCASRRGAVASHTPKKKSGYSRHAVLEGIRGLSTGFVGIYTCSI